MKLAVLLGTTVTIFFHGGDNGLWAQTRPAGAQPAIQHLSNADLPSPLDSPEPTATPATSAAAPAFSPSNSAASTDARNRPPSQAEATPEAKSAAESADMLTQLYANLQYPSPPAPATAPVIIFTPVAPKVVEEMEEDLTIMSSILEKRLERTLGQKVPEFKMGIPMLLKSDARSVQAMYVEGFGCLFFVKVNLPLVPHPSLGDQEQRPAASSEWERAKHELYGTRTGSTQESGHSLVGENFTEWVELTRLPVPQAAKHAVLVAAAPYDAAKVTALSEELLRALINASHIRHLKTNEWISVVVFGREIASPPLVVVNRPNEYRVFVDRNEPVHFTIKASGLSESQLLTALLDQFRIQSGRGSILTIRTRKADASAFAEGQLTFDEFRSRASQHRYGGYTGDLGSGFLGIAFQALTPDLAEALGLPKNTTGAVVTHVIRDSPAAEAGLKRGDIVIEFNGTVVGDYRELPDLVRKAKPGATVTIKVLRQGKEQTFQVILKPRDQASLRTVSLADLSEVLRDAEATHLQLQAEFQTRRAELEQRLGKTRKLFEQLQQEHQVLMNDAGRGKADTRGEHEITQKSLAALEESLQSLSQDMQALEIQIQQLDRETNCAFKDESEQLKDILLRELLKATNN